jgi:cytoskeletal protein RodZ
MAANIGEKLRLAREASGIPLRQIAEETRISIRYLEAIESGDFQRLPGGMFNRSFIRAYARCIKYDEAEALEIYASMQREHGEHSDHTARTPHKPLVYTDDQSARPALFGLLLAILALLILSGLVYLGLRWYQNRRAAQSNAAVDSFNRPSLPRQDGDPGRQAVLILGGIT